MYQAERSRRSRYAVVASGYVFKKVSAFFIGNGALYQRGILFALQQHGGTHYRGSFCVHHGTADLLGRYTAKAKENGNDYRYYPAPPQLCVLVEHT
jgi:hypothetical protein